MSLLPMNLPQFGGIFGTPPFVPQQLPQINPISFPTSPQAAGGGKLSQLLERLGGTQNIGLQLLANSGYSPQKRSLGEIVGTSVLGAKQMQQDDAQRKFREEYLQAQIEAMRRPDNVNQPSSVAEYEYAKKDGYKGTFEQWRNQGGPSAASVPSSLQEWQAFQKMSPEEQKQYLNMKRQPAAPQFAVIGNVPGLVDKIGQKFTPLTTAEAELQAIADKKAAEAAGTVQGEIAGQKQKKAEGANRVLSAVDEAEKFIKDATGSLAGAATDAVTGAFGYSTEGSKAIARLQILQANLMLEQPRMEGPQGVLDVQLYERMAGLIGDPTVPRERKLAALDTIRKLQNKYKEAAVVAPKSGASYSDPEKERRYQDWKRSQQK